jgi:hypothetical protein
MIISAPPKWDYSASVEKVRGMVIKWSTLTIELVEDLYRAREELDARGKNHGKEKVQDGTFSKYLEEVGLARRTVHAWLERYIPEEKKLLSVEELETRKQQEARAMAEKNRTEWEKAKDRVAEFKKTGKRPEGWGSRETAMEENEREFRENQEEARRRAEASNETMRRAQETLDAMADRLKDGWLAQGTAAQKREAFKERIRVSHEGKDDPFVDAIMDYLDTLDDDNRRVEACYNIIKVCKGIAVQIQAGGPK